MQLAHRQIHDKAGKPNFLIGGTSIISAKKYFSDAIFNGFLAIFEINEFNSISNFYSVFFNFRKILPPVQRKFPYIYTYRKLRKFDNPAVG